MIKPIWLVIFGGLALVAILAWDLNRTYQAKKATYNPNAQMSGALYVPRYHNG